MKPSLKLIVSGTFALLLTSTLTANASRPDGYTDDGQPFYYAYPDEGYADEENTDNSALSMPPDMSMPQASEYGYDDDSYSEPYTGWGSGIWGWGTSGIPFGQQGFFDNHFNHGKGFNHHDGMHHNFPMHTSVVPHHNSVAQGAVNNGRVMNGTVHAGAAVHAGGGHGGGGGHR